MSNYVVVDIETSIKEIHGRKAHYAFNPIIAICFKHSNEQARVYYKEGNWDEILEQELSLTKVMVAFNAKFECLHFWKYKIFQDWLANGGKIFCPQLTEYMLSGQQHRYPALRDVAVNIYGLEEREKLQEPYWENERGWITVDGYLNKNDVVGGHEVIGPIDTKDIPRELVLEDVTNDVLDTEQVMLKQIKIAKKEGMFKLIVEQMEGLLFTTEAEYNGIYTHIETLQRNQKALELELIELHEKVKYLGDQYISGLNYGSTKDLSRLFFGGHAKVKTDEPMLNELGVPIVIKSGPNRGQVKTKIAVKEVYTRGLGLQIQASWKTKKDGVYQTNEGVLAVLAKETVNKDGANIAKIMLQIREKEKMMSTYYAGFTKYIHESDSCIHGNLNHVVTETGRTSSTKPNLQNLPNG